MNDRAASASSARRAELKRTARKVLEYFSDCPPPAGNELGCHYERLNDYKLRLTRMETEGLVEAGAMAPMTAIRSSDRGVKFNRNRLEALADVTLAALHEQYMARPR